MSVLDIRPADSCEYDLVSLGEVMLRFDPGEGRIRNAREFRVWEGGGEYNVARGLRRCFGQRTAIVTALADNEIGRLVEDLIMTGNVDTSMIRWIPYDGIGRQTRNGLNFTERGFGVRGAVGVSDRGHTAVASMRPDDIDWEDLFGRRGVRWFHTGGIFGGLSATTPDVMVAAMTSAKRHGTVISYDLNYRPSLWNDTGGATQAQEVNRRVAGSVDVMFGNEEDFTASLGYDVVDGGVNLDNLAMDDFTHMIESVVSDLPNLKIVATTMREVRSASINDWGAVAWSADGFVHATQRDGLEIMDRVGGGDSFASGLVHAMLEGHDLSTAIEYGAAHGALVMTTPGDTSTATLQEVEALVRGANARVQR